MSVRQRLAQGLFNTFDALANVGTTDFGQMDLTAEIRCREELARIAFECIELALALQFPLTRRGVVAQSTDTMASVRTSYTDALKHLSKVKPAP
jgi:hypothetical protein